MDGWLFALTLAAALGCAVMSGLFFAFSNFIMRALDRLPGTQGMAAMRSINVAILTPLFLLALMGTAALCVALGVVAVFRLDEHDGPYLLAGSLLYLVGAVGLTMAYHVPRNDALEATEPDDPSAPALWDRYLAEWLPWNHVRTVACLAATAMLIVAVR
jgi:uncharacterized membrane protein